MWKHKAATRDKQQQKYSGDAQNCDRNFSPTPTPCPSLPHYTRLHRDNYIVNAQRTHKNNLEVQIKQ